jgi:hypothetical protein
MLALTPPAAARMLSVPLARIRFAMRTGELDARRCGTRFLIEVESAKQWLRSLPPAYPTNNQESSNA